MLHKGSYCYCYCKSKNSKFQLSHDILQKACYEEIWVDVTWRNDGNRKEIQGKLCLISLETYGWYFKDNAESVWNTPETYGQRRVKSPLEAKRPIFVNIHETTCYIIKKGLVVRQLRKLLDMHRQFIEKLSNCHSDWILDENSQYHMRHLRYNNVIQHLWNFINCRMRTQTILW